MSRDFFFLFHNTPECLNTGHKANFRTLHMDLRKREKYIVIFRCRILRILASMHYVKEIIFKLI